MKVRKLLASDAAALVVLRAEALALEPLAFSASPHDDLASNVEVVCRFLDQPESQAAFGCFRDSVLVGMAGLARATKEKQRHKATVWGMYVRSDVRRMGVARVLLSAVIEQGREWGVDHLLIGATEAAAAARRLYESAGFRVWGREPRALQWESRFVDEEHLILDLSAP